VSFSRLGRTVKPMDTAPMATCAGSATDLPSRRRSIARKRLEHRRARAGFAPAQASPTAGCRATMFTSRGSSSVRRSCERFPLVSSAGATSSSPTQRTPVPVLSPCASAACLIPCARACWWERTASTPACVCSACRLHWAQARLLRRARAGAELADARQTSTRLESW